MFFILLNAIERHLKDAKMTYSQHMKHALKLSCRLGYASFALLLHSICPCMFQTTGSETIRNLYQQLADDGMLYRKSKLLRID